MKIKEVQLKGFKRFTDTKIVGIPESARLVVVVGPNGSGKSSLIDGLYSWHGRKSFGAGEDPTYHKKETHQAGWSLLDAVSVVFHGDVSAADLRKAIYVRSAYRNEADFLSQTLQPMELAVNERRFSRLIDADQAVSANYRRLVSQGFSSVFETADASQTIGQFREKLVGGIRDSMKKIFPDLSLSDLGNPLVTGTFRFDKGDSKNFLYKNLSAGEKAAFDLVLDVVVKKMEYNDTVFVVDEPEAHIGTALQGPLLRELFDLVPESGQLWVTTHSLGMMREARSIAGEYPDGVVFLDFDARNFDSPTEIRPAVASRPFWKRALQIALHDIADLVAPEKVVFCEGGGRDFDVACYMSIFENEFPSVLFVSGGGSGEVTRDKNGMQKFLNALAPSSEIERLLDRDDRTEAEIEQLRRQGVRVLNRRHIESYLLDDEVLISMLASIGHSDKTQALLDAKKLAIEGSVQAGGPVDDLKRPAGDIFNAVKKITKKRYLGSDARAFMREFCAPRIVPGTAAYAELRRHIFEN